MFVTLRHHLRSSAVLAAAVATAAPAAAQLGVGLTPTQTAPTTGAVPLQPDAQLASTPYAVLDNVEGPWVNLNVAPIRPLAQTADRVHLYALNTHASLVQHFAGAAGDPKSTFRVPWGPVSVAIWPAATEAELLVVCRGSHVLARLDRLTGETLGILPLPFEPGDLVVDHVRDRAFVACSGADSVVEIDLASNALVATYALPSKHPLFLSFDANGTDVLVAPMLSGNNSVVRKIGPYTARAIGDIVDLASPATPVGLPDEDLFRIDPVAGTVTPVLRGTGTVLFAHGVHPTTGRFWQLNTEANNKDPLLQSEADLQGVAVRNRLTITTLPAPGGAANGLHEAVIDLDDSDALTPGPQVDPNLTIGQPYGLEFLADGRALVTGLLTDNVTVLSALGRYQNQLDLAPGSIPRQTLAYDANTIYVYCWGTNRVEVWDTGATWTLTASLDLGLDPAPTVVREGRALFYDASHSLHNNQSCASCHVEGRTDMALWNLSDPLDDKGPLVTQTLAGIERTPPYHWRGERASLADFNVSFPSLLGGAPLSTVPDASGTSELDRFQAFVFSIQSPANPNQDPLRVVSDAYGPPPPSGKPRGSAVRGQDLFLRAPTDGGLTCTFCHTLPSGTSNDTTADEPDDGRPKRTTFEVTSFAEIWRKEQPEATVTFAGGATGTYSVLGAGLTHAGLSTDLFEFVNEHFELDDQEVADIVAFVDTIDQGLAPYAHRAVRLHASTLAVATGEALRMVQQAARRNVDLAAYGTVDLGDGPRTLAWHWDRATGRFLAEDSSLASRGLVFFLNQARAGTGNVVLVGLPVGMGRPWGTDFDDDGVLNLDEALHGTSPFLADSDGDGHTDGQELEHGGDPTDVLVAPTDLEPPQVRDLRVQWVTAKVAKLVWETDEPTTFAVDAFTTAGPVRSVSGDVPKTLHQAFLPSLLPSTEGGPEFEYQGTLTAYDLAGNPASVPLPPFTTGALVVVPGEATLGNLHWTQLQVDTAVPTTLVGPVQTQQLTGRAQVRVRSKSGGPPFASLQDYVVVATLHVNGSRSASFSSQNPTSFTVGGLLPVIEGPFVISSPTGANGIAELQFQQPGLQRGDELILNVEAVVPIDPASYIPSTPDFVPIGGRPPLGFWDFPATPVASRSLSTTF